MRRSWMSGLKENMISLHRDLPDECNGENGISREKDNSR